MNPSDPSLRPSTVCIRAGTHLDETTGGACSPIYSSTAFAFPNPANENFYPRYFNTPNQHVIEAKMAALEKGRIGKSIRVCRRDVPELPLITLRRPGAAAHNGGYVASRAAIGENPRS